MLRALKSMDKKFLIMAGVVLGVPILLIIFLAIMQGCGNSKVSHESYEEKMILAAQKYIKNKGLLESNKVSSYYINRIEKNDKFYKIRFKL